MNAQTLAISLPLLGVLFVGAGLLYRNNSIAGRDQAIFLKLHHWLRRWRSFFATMWIVGTTPVALVLLAILFIPGWRIGLAAVAVYMAASGIESATKNGLQRPRPFEALVEVEMSQPKRPSDASHPSGDALRVWFFAIAVPIAFGLPPISLVITALLAVLVSLGRIALGVHYPLDVISGSGLGLFAAGILMWFFI